MLIREGSGGVRKLERPWLGRSSGVRVYMEGFRVLPYGEPGDDWLKIDADYTQRTRTLGYLKDAQGIRLGSKDEDAALSGLRNSAYFGAVFLTQKGAPTLRMLVNREGFVPAGAFDSRTHRFISAADDLAQSLRSD